MKSVERAAALGADLILTHHPLIFSAVKRINEGDYLGERLLKIIENHMACYAMHTNYDVKRMGKSQRSAWVSGRMKYWKRPPKTVRRASVLPQICRRQFLSVNTEEK